MKKCIDTMELPLGEILGLDKESDFVSPEEYTYWANRRNRIFHIDYEIDDCYRLYELSKIIIQMNVDEKDVPNPEPIKIFIHSYGGDLDQTNFFCDLCACSRIPIYTIATGVAMSAGFLILLSGKKRFAFKHTQALVHTGSAAFQGTAEQIEEAQKNYKKQINQMKEYILEKSSIDEKLFNRNKSKDWYLSSSELVEYNVVDKVITDISEIL